MEQLLCLLMSSYLNNNTSSLVAHADPGRWKERIGVKNEDAVNKARVGFGSGFLQWRDKPKAVT